MIVNTFSSLGIFKIDYAYSIYRHFVFRLLSENFTNEPSSQKWKKRHMKKDLINVVITDLDDTIWDWLKMWYSSFEPYLSRISTELEIDIEDLKKDFKKIHQTYHSTEASFIYDELETLSDNQKQRFILASNKQKSILHEYYSLKKNNLLLYDGVYDTLKDLKSKGTLIIGFTESNAFFTKYRLKHLGLDGLIDYIYAPIDKDVPESVNIYYEEGFWEPKKTEFRYLSPGTKKPAPEILEIIIRDFGIDKKKVIYIGDKLIKDISMANEAGVISVHAEYGEKIATNEYALLREVTHWTDEEVEKEKSFREKHQETALADFTLKKSFKELYKYFNFESFRLKPNTDNIDVVIEIWKKTVDVQQHFNEIGLKIRNLAVTIYTFILGAIGYTYVNRMSFNNLPIAALIAGLGVFSMLAFFYMDKFWYHRFLKGAGETAGNIENRWSKIIPELKLSTNISNKSPHRIFFINRFKVKSGSKLNIFYCFLILPLLAIIIILLCSNSNL